MGYLAQVFTQLVEWMTELFEMITNQPILLLGLGIFALGAVIGLARRLIGS